MFDTRIRLFFFACLKDAAGADLKSRLQVSALTNKKIGSGSGAAPKMPPQGNSGSATLLKK